MVSVNLLLINTSINYHVMLSGVVAFNWPQGCWRHHINKQFKKKKKKQKKTSRGMQLIR